MQNFIGRIFIVTTLVATLSGCALAVRRTEVADLKYNPGRYYDKTVSVDGVVTSSWGVPLCRYKLYKVDDGTGEVTVVSQDGRTPTRGAHVRVQRQGQLRSRPSAANRWACTCARPDLDFKGR